MTDEEKAEEHVKKQILKHNRDVVLRPKKAVKYIDELKQAYLDGLAEGRKEKWHDLRKDPNDLPKETGHYLTDDGEYIYDTDCKKWRTLTCMICWDFNWLDDGDVIAWCELPKFEE